jgi:serine O-acetyltransferase
MTKSQTPVKIADNTSLKAPAEFFPTQETGKVGLFSSLINDFKVIKQRDPAARNWLEILFCYPGLQALFLHRIAHLLYGFGLPFLPRLLSHFSRLLTGVEIHPGAKIGQGVFIDHGMGVVIGETAIVGDYCLIYQGVTLGGTGKETGKRHPTLGSHVLIGAGAKLLGNITIGDHVRVGAGSIVLRSVPSHCTVVGVPGRITRNSKKVDEDSLNNQSFPDPEAEVIRNLFDRLKVLELQIQELKTSNNLLTDENTITTEITESDQIIEDFLYGAGI